MASFGVSDIFLCGPAEGALDCWAWLGAGLAATGLDVADSGTGEAVADGGVGGGGIEPFGGPYWMIGLVCGCDCDGCGCSFGRDLGSLTTNIVASIMCGSIAIVRVPTLVMLSLGGFLGSSLTTPFRLWGFVQYFSKRPSWIHLWRDRESDSARTPLHQAVSAIPSAFLLECAFASTHLSPMDW